MRVGGAGCIFGQYLFNLINRIQLCGSLLKSSAFGQSVEEYFCVIVAFLMLKSKKRIS